MLTQENNALKNILKDAVIVYDDDNMRQVSNCFMRSLLVYWNKYDESLHSDWPIQFCDTLLVSVNEQPLLRSGLDYDQLPPIAPAAKPSTLSSLNLQTSTQSNTSSLSSRKLQEFASKSAPVSPLSTPSHSHGSGALSSHHFSHHALEVSLQDNKVTSFKTDPLNPEITSAKGSIKPASGGGILATQQAAESIKKLYDLTFTESQKEESQRLLEAKEKPEEEEEIDSSVKEEAVAAPSGPFMSFRKSFKMSQRHRELRKRSAKSEGSPELPHVASNPSSRRKTIAGGKVEKPKFYLRDILPVLKERNQLKEQVHLLEDEVASLKR